MKVKLIGVTQPVEELKLDGIEAPYDLIAFCARVSNPKNQYNVQTAEQLINYLISHKHWSPLEMVNVVLEIETTRDIARQILRHRSFSFQEYSQRYANPLDDLEYVIKEPRLQDSKNRQNSLTLDMLPPEDKLYIQAGWAEYQERVKALTEEAYKWAISMGIAKECARAVLPEGMIKSRMYMNGTLRSWVHYLELRTEKGTQKEHREVAKACAEAISRVFPMVEKFV
jgi:thymidylate synthase (FAD)